MTVIVWTKMKAIEAMTASLGLPNMGWQSIYLLLCTIPSDWVVGGRVER